MKHQLKLMPAEHRIVLLAVRGYMSYVSDNTTFLRQQLNIAYNKVLYSANPNLDGMEMILIVKALRRRANMFLLLNKETERNLYLSLSNKIDLERQRFQEANNPLRKIKTASAPTLTA